MKKNRWVIKLGTGLLSRKDGTIDRRQIAALVAQFAALMQKGYEIVVVSSGAIAAGMTAMDLSLRPTRTAELQACATIGQIELMSEYQRSLRKHGLLGGQLLLTYGTLDSRTCWRNASLTLEHLLAQKHFVPIINENDAIANEEIKVGDNDRLSAYVAELVQAETLIILSSIDGLLTKLDGTGEVIPLVTQITPDIRALAAGPGTQRNVGGMITKLLAAEIAARAGARTIIANGRTPDILLQVAGDKFTGTRFKLAPVPAKSRK